MIIFSKERKIHVLSEHKGGKWVYSSPPEAAAWVTLGPERTIDTEIPYKMILSSNVFEFTSKAALEKNIRIRKAIIDAAKSARMGMGPDIFGNNHWTDGRGGGTTNGSAFEAIQDIWNKKSGHYRIGCYFAALYTMEKGIADVIGQTAFEGRVGSMPAAHGSLLYS